MNNMIPSKRTYLLPDVRQTDANRPKELCERPARNDDVDYYFKIHIKGGAGVGKTTIMQRFLNDPFQDEYVPTNILEMRRMRVEYKGKIFQLHFFDRAGDWLKHEYTTQLEKGADATLFVFDVSDLQSHEKLIHWIKEDTESQGSEAHAAIVVGNKYDVIGHECVGYKRFQDAQSGLHVDRDVVVVGTSAKTGLNVPELLTMTIEAICRQKGIELDPKPDLLVDDKKDITSSDLFFKSRIDLDWQNAAGHTYVDKAIAILARYTANGSRLFRVLSGHPWRWGVHEIDGIINDHNKNPISTIEELVSRLERIPQREPNTYLSDFIDYLNDELYLKLRKEFIPQPESSNANPTY